MSVIHPALGMVLVLSLLAANYAAMLEARQAFGVKRRCTCRRWIAVESICVAAGWGTWLTAPARSGGLAVAIIGTVVGLYAVGVVRAIHRRGGHDDDHGSGRHVRMWLHRKLAPVLAS